MIAVVLVCFIVSEITRNYSQVDKLWSLGAAGIRMDNRCCLSCRQGYFSWQPW
ncbi:MAG: hypothetical protein MZV63_00620 [Marinilabiliales bacterium]|nr:hypothetical protein [Marinilabiliales bacterium]